MKKRAQWMTISVLLLFAFMLTVGACSSESDTSDDMADGDAPSDGDEPDGDTPDGDSPDGDSVWTSDGDAPDGDEPDGDYYPDGDTPDGDTPDGDMPEDGDTPDGDTPDGDLADGDLADGDDPDGDAPDGDVDTSLDGDEDGDIEIDGDEEEPQYACPEEQTPYRMYLSSDDSNSVASPVAVRSQAMSGGYYSADLLRIWEFLNYYRISYPTPPTGEDIAAFADMSPTAEAGVYTLQVAARSYDMASRAGRPMNLTFILDTSGSMSGSPIQYLRRVCQLIAGQLRAGDKVSMVTWSSNQTAVLNQHEVSGPNDATLVNAIQRITSGGGTDLHGGLVRGYQLAEAMFAEDANNRVLLISDGGANLGITDKSLIARHADDADGKGIYMVGVAVGDSFNDTLLDEVTDAGRGAYIYIDSPEEADEMFGPRFYENMEIAARAVRVEVVLPWYFMMKEFHGEEWSQNPNEVEPQHLAPNDAMVFHQEIVACDPDLIDLDDEITLTISYGDARTLARKTVTKTVKVGEILFDRLDSDNSFPYSGFYQSESLRLTKGNAIVAYAKLLEAVLTDRRAGTEVPLLAAEFEALGTRTLDPDYADMAAVLRRIHD